MKKKFTIFAILIITVIIGCLTAYHFLNQEEILPDEPIVEDNVYREYKDAKITVIKSYQDYLKYKDIADQTNEVLSDFDNYVYVLVTYRIDYCSSHISNEYYKVEKGKLNIYMDEKITCGVCAPDETTDVFKVNKKDYKENITVYYKTIHTKQCNTMIAYKPMIYIYPKKDMDVTIELGRKELLTSTYPKLNDKWKVHVSKDGNIYDYNTKRNYYGLYWEAIDPTELNMDEGFVVKGKDTIKFLEEKLSILGLSEYEINEFIVYWISKLENNKYNFIRFRTIDEINDFMPLIVDSKPDTLIRVLMDFTPLEESIEVKEQELTKVERKGYTIVEWGATPHTSLK